MSSAILRLTAFCCVVAAVTAFRSLIPRKQMTSFNMGPGEVDGVPQDGRALSRSDIAKISFPVASFAALVVPFLQSKNVFAADEVVATEEKAALGPPPVDFGLEYKDYYTDSAKVVNHMRYAVQMEKGNPRLAEIAQKTKDETLDYVSYYRRFSGISGKQSFSLLYTSINVLSGHYTSYGVKFPVPEKRRKRLLQEFNDIEKNIRKKR